MSSPGKLPPSPASRPPGRWRAWGTGALIILLTAACYWPALRGEFIYDDDATLTGNALVQAPDGLKKFWTSTEQMDYWPVTYSSLWFEWRLWGMDSTGYHVTNLVLHLAAVFLLWAALRRLHVPGAWLAALLFAVHPVNVEAVAWIAQRKTVLAVVFYFAAVLAFAKAGLADREAPPARLSGSARAWYAASLAAFLLGMLSKGSVATAPLILLALIWWRRPVEWRDARRLTPFFAIAGILALVNVWFQTHGSSEVIRSATWLERGLGAAAVVWFYLGQALAPLRLIFIYPQWDIRADEWRWWLPLLAALGLTGWLVWRRHTGWGRPALVAWLCFAAALVPVMGLVDIYFMKYALVADHYEYVALPAVLALAAAGWARWYADSPAARAPAALVAATVVAALAFLSWRQAQLYQNLATLYPAAAAANPESWSLRYDLGTLRLSQGRYDDAQAELEASLRLEPGTKKALNNLGMVWLEQGQWAKAKMAFDLALRNDLGSPAAEPPGIPDYRRLNILHDFSQASNNLAFTLLQLGKVEEAVAQSRATLRLDPGNAEAQSNLGNGLLELGRTQEAIAELQQAAQARPNLPETHFDLSRAYLRAGDFPAEIAQLQQALGLRPNDPKARNNLANALFKTGRVKDAIPQYQEAVRESPGVAELHFNFAQALLQAGQTPAALAQLQETLRLKPGLADAHNLIGSVMLQQNRRPEAIAQYEAALQLQPNYAEAHNNLGVALYLSDRYAEAQAQCEMALQLAPDFAAARADLEKIRAALAAGAAGH
jgi:tetratricopeptide (TPR) repeat protein